MPKDVPTGEKSPRERGTYANHGDDPTLMSYLSSAFFVLSVPSLILLAYGGYWADLYAESTVVPVFTALLLGSLAAVFGVIHAKTGR